MPTRRSFPSFVVTVRLPTSLHWRVRGQQVGETSATAGDRIVVDLNLEGADDAGSYLLGLGSAVEVLGPPSAREAIAAESARISGLYAGALIRRG